jgi:hypothetical protein
MPEPLKDADWPRDAFRAQRHEQNVEIQRPKMRLTVTRVGDIDPAAVYRMPTQRSGNCAPRFLRATSFHRDP